MLLRRPGAAGATEATEDPAERSEPVKAAGPLAPAPRGVTPEGDPPLPGIVRADEAITAKLRQALAAKGAGYAPRTRHFDDDGRPTYVNRLILETSPYLLQHAHNPVNWYPWGDEAFARARREGKPVLLSIGYSTCHWCHVMERESFEDEEIAAYLNANYIAIKVDREERPDVDDVYMKAVQMLTGRGGWPMTTVLTPERRPFFGGTYFPARDGDRGARKGFLTILKELKAEHDSDREAVVRRAAQISERIRSASEPAPPGDVPGAEAIVTPAATAEAEPLLDQVRRTYVPNRILTVTPAGDELEQRVALMPLRGGKRAIGGKPTAFVCDKGHCELPTSAPEVLRKQLSKVKPLQQDGSR